MALLGLSPDRLLERVERLSALKASGGRGVARSRGSTRRGLFSRSAVQGSAHGARSVIGTTETPSGRS